MDLCTNACLLSCGCLKPLFCTKTALALACFVVFSPHSPHLSLVPKMPAECQLKWRVLKRLESFLDTVTILWCGIQEDSANNATAYTCHWQQSLNQMRWSKWTEPQKHILSFAIFLEKIKSRPFWDVKLNSCLWHLGELEEWWRVWKKACLRVTFFTAFICCCYGDWSTVVLRTCFPTQIQLGKCSQCFHEWEVKFLILIYIPFAKCWRSKIPPL